MAMFGSNCHQIQGMKLSRLLRLFEKHGIWAKVIYFGDDVAVLTRTKTFFCELG